MSLALNKIIERDPGTLGGTPVFAGTRVPFQNLIDCLEAGDSIDLFLYDFPTVAREQVVAVLEAAKENVPESPIHLRDGLPPPDLGPFDAIISNPPFHRGKTEAPDMIGSLVRGAPALLQPKGMLVFVAQKRLSLEGALRTSFREVAVLAESPTFRVWMGRRPRKVSGQV